MGNKQSCAHRFLHLLSLSELELQVCSLGHNLKLNLRINSFCEYLSVKSNSFINVGFSCVQ